MDWGQPYSCTSWAETFGQTFPVLDDNSGNNIYALFGIGYVPHNVVIGGDGTVIYSQSGHNLSAILTAIEEGIENLVLDMDADGVMDNADNCIEDYNPNQIDVSQSRSSYISISSMDNSKSALTSPPVHITLLQGSQTSPIPSWSTSIWLGL